jgi:WD40 repeat protein
MNRKGSRAVLRGLEGSNALRLPDPSPGERLRRFEGHMGWVFDVAFSPDGKRLYSASADGTVREWHVSDWQLDDLVNWVYENRYVRDFTCEERAQYHIAPLCE